MNQLRQPYVTRLACALLLLVAVAGCKDHEPKLTVAGTWQGMTGGQTITLSLTENGGTVGGSGTITNTPTGTRALTAQGSFIAPQISVTLSSGSAQPFNLTASVSASSMDGTLNGSGFTNDPIALTRQ